MEKFWSKKRMFILIAVSFCGSITGRLAVRAVLNLLLGGTMIGGNLL